LSKVTYNTYKQYINSAVSFVNESYSLETTWELRGVCFKSSYAKEENSVKIVTVFVTVIVSMAVYHKLGESVQSSLPSFWLDYKSMSA
jgi:hypothetical protein